jgi:N-acetylmuramoyl-L-alanine amidase
VEYVIAFARIFIDAGHGPHNGHGDTFDPGATSKYGGEYQTVSLIAGSIPSTLQRYPHSDRGIDIIRTPELSINDLTAWVNKESKPGDAFITLHLNESDSEKASGVEVVVAGTASPERYAQARALGTTVAQELRLKFRRVIADTETPRGRIGILRQTDIPAFVLELGFVSNQNDVLNVKKYGRQAVCEGIRALAGEMK